MSKRLIAIAKKFNPLIQWVIVPLLVVIIVTMVTFIVTIYKPPCGDGPFLRDGNTGQIICPGEIESWLVENVTTVESTGGEKFPLLSTVAGVASIIIIIIIIIIDTPTKKTKKHN